MINLGHAIMFHHFYDNDKHIYQQGAINKNDLLNILDYYSQNIIYVREYLENLITEDEIYKKLSNRDESLLLNPYIK